MPAKWDQIRVSFYLNQLEKVSEFIAKVALQYELSNCKWKIHNIYSGVHINRADSAKQAGN